MSERAWQWTPQRRIGYPTIAELAVSPDGRRIAYVVREPLMTDERSEMIGHVYLAEVDGGAAPVQLTFGDQRDWHPRWSPDGRHLAFLSKRTEKANVYALRVDGGEAFAVTKCTKSDVATFAWSPEGERLALVVPEAPSDEKEKQRKSGDDQARFEVDDEFQQLYVVPFVAGARQPAEPLQLTSDRLQVLACEWLPDGQRIAYTRMPGTAAENWTGTTVALAAASGDGAPRELAAVAALNSRPFPSPDGRWIACLGQPAPASWAFAMRACLVPSEGGEPRWLPPTPDESGELIGWSRDGAELYLAEPEGTSTAIRALPAAGGPLRTMASGPRSRTWPTVSPAGRIAFVVGAFDEPNAVYVLDEVGERVVARPPLPPDWPSGPLPEAEVLRWRARDGREIEGIVVYPIGHQPGRRYRLIVDVHGGPAGVFQRGYLGGPGGQTDAAALAERGYAVLRANPRGSSGYGREFRLANRGDWAGGDFEDIMAGVDHLIERGLADPERLGIVGWSYGGFMTGMAITLTDRFKAACFGAGLSNLSSFTGTADIQSFLPDYFGAEIWEAPEAYARCSAVLNAAKVGTPTLIQHGEADKRVPVSQGYELYFALKRRGVPVEMVVYPREGHGVDEPRHQIDLRRRVLAWLERWIPAGAEA